MDMIESISDESLLVMLLKLLELSLVHLLLGRDLVIAHHHFAVETASSLLSTLSTLV